MIGGSGMNNGSSMDNGGVDNRSSMNSSTMIDGSMGKSGGSMDSSNRLLITTISMDALGSSMGLAAYSSMNSTMGLVDSVADGGSIAKLDGLVVDLVSRHSSNKQSTDK